MEPEEFRRLVESFIREHDLIPPGGDVTCFVSGGPDSACLGHALGALEGEVRWGEWRISAAEKGLKVRGWRAGDRLAAGGKKIQDVFVDAKIPRSEREAWPLVVRGGEVVAVPGIVEREGVKAERVAG
jgi:tRNA(Ile)-lysidine synthetase-like protein